MLQHNAVLRHSNNRISDSSTPEKCKLCKGSGEIVTTIARQMGYTFSFNEHKDSIEEQIILCPRCKGGQ